MPKKSWIKKIGRIILDCLLLIYGLAYYHLNRKKPLGQRTPGKSYLSMVRIFCLTSGWSNDIISKLISYLDKPIRLPDYQGVLGNLSTNQLEEITSSLEKDGFYIFEQKLPDALVKRLYDFALNQESVPRLLDDEDIDRLAIKIHYDKNNLKAAVYDIPPEISLSNPIIQALLQDHSILSVAQSYLRASPKVEPIGLWWSTPFCNKPQTNSAQLFHFDLDRFKWIKFFIFLTDVTAETGPHVFISQTHRRGGIPKSLLKSGYSRHSDEEIFKHFSKENIKTFTVPAGTILAEDTRGLHKGTHLLKDERLVLELQFSNCLFGAVAPSLHGAVIQDPKLIQFANQYPKIFKLYPMPVLK